MAGSETWAMTSHDMRAISDAIKRGFALVEQTATRAAESYPSDPSIQRIMRNVMADIQDCITDELLCGLDFLAENETFAERAA
jgi:hypothetical protein